MCRARDPPFSALNFCSGAYNFHKFPKNPFRSITILHFLADFCRSGDHHFQNFFNFNPFIASHGRLSPNAKRSAAPRVSQTRPGSSGDSHFHAQNGSSSFRSPGIFKLKTAQAHSGAPHFHARPGAPFFTLPRHIPTKIWGEYPPPPPGNFPSSRYPPPTIAHAPTLEINPPISSVYECRLFF